MIQEDPASHIHSLDKQKLPNMSSSSKILSIMRKNNQSTLIRNEKGDRISTRRLENILMQIHLQ